MKKYIISLITLTLAFSINAQISPQDIIGINLNDSPNILTIDSTKVERQKKITPRASYYPGIELQPHIPKSYNINKNYAVGEITYMTKVDHSGAMTMSVPIEIPQNSKGASPQIGLTYNSNAPNGVVGIGWSISGLSQISRTNKSIYYDGKTEGVKYHNVDAAFILDGIRLIKLSSTATSITYQTEQGNIKVVASISGTLFNYFTVYYPNGNVAIYGNINGTSSTSVSHPLTKMTDLYGNVINYTYTYTNGYYSLNKITYGQLQQISVEFTYSTSRSSYDIPTIYIGGYPVTYNNILSKVETKYSGTVINTYQLTYSTIAKASLLSKIECSQGGKTLNPLIIYYGDNKQSESFSKANTQMMEWYNYTTANQLRVTKGKFDYGSEDDGIITLPSKSSFVEHYRHSTAFRHSENWIYNDYKGDEKIIISTGLSGDLAWFCPTLKTEAGFLDIFCGDLDEFEGEEIIKVNSNISGSQEKLDFHVYTPNLYAGIAKKYTRTFYLNSLLDHRGKKSITPKFFYIGDFNGDGKTDILAVSTSGVIGSKTTVYLFDLENNKMTTISSPFNFFVQYRGDDAQKNSDKLYAIDYDGDGKTDLALIDGDGLKLYTLDVAGTTHSIRHVHTNSGLKKSNLADRDFLAGDFNGDGKVDFLLSPVKNGGSTWTIYNSEGDGWYRGKDISITTKIESSRFLVQDINGDGQADLVETYGTSDNVTLATYFIANNQYVGRGSTSVTKESIVIPTNINNYNYNNQLVAIKNGIATRISFKANYSKSRLLTGVVNSIGNVTKFEYSQLNEDKYGMLYSKGYGAKFPYQNYYGGLNVLSATETYNNSVRISGAYYQYSNAIVHKQGLGFRGFERINSNDLVTGDYITTIYDPLKFSIVKSIEDSKSSVTNTHNVSVGGNKIANITLAKKVEINKAKGASATKTYTFDSYGNVTKELSDFGGGLKATVTNVYNNHTGTTYLLGEMVSQTKVNERSGTSSLTTKQEYFYNAARLITSKKYSVNNNIESEESYIYDTNKNITESKSKAYTSPNWLSTKYVYDTFGRVTKQTDPMGFYVTYTYNAKNQISSQKNQKNLETKFEYDELGRNVKTTNPDGTIQTISFSWASTPTGAITLKTFASTGQPATQSYYNALGQEVRTGTMRFDGSYLYTDFVFDNRGRLQKSSLPFKGASATKWNTYTYDSFDRILTLSYASGKKDTYSYKAKSTTSTIDNVTRTTNFDELGNTLSVSDPAGTIAFSLRADGQPISITAPSNVVTRFEYDGYGRKTKITDPSAGTTITAYDVSGNISQQTDARNKVTKYTYDTYNRMTKKEVVGEFTTTYNYNSDGLLASQSSTNGTGKNYTYDGLMRISTEKETIVDGKWLQKTVSYANGNTSSIAYSSNTGNIATENYVYTHGTLTEVKLNNTTSVWKLTKENELGKAIEAKSGDLIRNYGYDSFGMPTARSIKKGSSFIQNFGYNINPTTGNLNWRKDNIRNIQENFGYDNLNRLTSFNGKTVSYDEKGNITNMSSVGKFGYTNSAKPYALTEVTPNGSSIPLRDQSVAYNGLMRPSSIAEDIYTTGFAYNTDGDRVKMQIKKNNIDDLVRYYLGNNYEVDAGTAGAKERLYIGGDAYTASAVYVKEGGAWSLYYLGRDYLGSITHIIQQNGTLKQELSYDPWGNLRNPANQQIYATGTAPVLILGRGFTGHEHLAMFGLINMNARLYDPVLGRFLSPDPYVQVPFLSQNFNRYAYAMNNPLRFTDASGEFIPLLIVAVVGFGIGYTSYGIATGNWGFEAVTAGLISAAGSLIGVGIFSGTALSYSAALVYSAKDVATAILSNIIPPLNLNLGDFGISLSPVAFLSAGVGKAPFSGFKFGGAISVSAKVGDWTFMASGNVFKGGSGATSFGFNYDDGKRGIGFMWNRYMGQNSQTTGTIMARHGDFSLRWENDLMGDKNDRWRSNATEVGYKNYFIGTNVFTNNPKDEEGYNGKGDIRFGEENNGSELFNNNYGTYKNGEKLSSPAYFGIKTNRGVSRVGINAPIIGDFIQNGFHHLPFVKSPNFNPGSYGTSGYYESGSYFPGIMY